MQSPIVPAAQGLPTAVGPGVGCAVGFLVGLTVVGAAVTFFSQPLVASPSASANKLLAHCTFVHVAPE